MTPTASPQVATKGNRMCQNVAIQTVGVVGARPRQIWSSRTGCKEKARARIGRAVMQKTVVKRGRGADARPIPRGKTSAPKSEMLVGIDLHKAFLNVAVIGSGGQLLLNKRVENTFDYIRKEFSQSCYAGLNLAVTAVSGSADLSWTDANDTGSGRYRVERSVDGGPFAEIENQPGAGTDTADRLDPEWSGKHVTYGVFEWVGSQKLYSEQVSFTPGPGRDELR